MVRVTRCGEKIFTQNSIQSQFLKKLNYKETLPEFIAGDQKTNKKYRSN
jgi:hypothetical protein